jgi:hypothetical protein
MKIIRIQPASQPSHRTVRGPAAVTAPSDLRADADRRPRFAFRNRRAVPSKPVPRFVSTRDHPLAIHRSSWLLEIQTMAQPKLLSPFERSSNAARRRAPGAINAPCAALKYESLIRRSQQSHPLPPPRASALAPPPSPSTQHPVGVQHPVSSITHHVSPESFRGSRLTFHAAINPPIQ